jgi:MFS family permease
MVVSERDVVAKLTWRLMPILAAAYFVAIVDRSNIGVAALTMNHDLGLSSSAFGFAAGVFFIPYVLLELPSNLALARFGARWWIARIMLTWGLISAAHALAWNGPSLYALRALLGAAEAGLVPGVIFYLTLWFPAAYRGRIISAFMLAIPVALVVGTPISALLLQLDGIMGLRGWQWMYILESLPAAILAIFIPFILPGSPKDAKFLTGPEREWLIRRLDQDKGGQGSSDPADHGSRWLQALLNPQVLLFCLMYYGLTNLNGAVSTFLPQILKERGFGSVQTGFIATIPYAFGALGMLALGALADRPGKRVPANFAALAIAVLGFLSASSTNDPMLKLASLSFAAFGAFAAIPVFWGLPTSLFGGAAAAASIALINALGNISSVVNPWVIGLLRDRGADYNGGLHWLAAMAGLSALVLTIIVGLRGRFSYNRVG